MANQPTALWSPASTSSIPSTNISWPISPSKGQLRASWLAMSPKISVLPYIVIGLARNEPIPTWETLFAITVLQPLLILCSKLPKISAAIYKCAWQQRLRLYRCGTGTPKYHTLPFCLKHIVSPLNIHDPSTSFGTFELFLLTPQRGWVGLNFPQVFSSHGFFSRLIRGEEDLVGRKVYEVEVEQVLKHDHIDAVMSMGRITGRVVRKVLGVCEVGDRVAVDIKERSVNSDGWKTEAWREA